MKRNLSPHKAVHGFLICLFTTTALASAAPITVNYTAQPGQRSVTDSSDEPLSNGHEVRLGFFNSEVELTSDLSLTDLQEQWNPYHQTTVRTLSGQPGRFSASFSDDETGFAGEKIYLWVLQTSDAGPVNEDLGNVTEFGIYSSSNPMWVFPSGNDPLASAVLVTSDQVDESYVRGSLTSDHLQLESIDAAPPVLTYAQWSENNFTEMTSADMRQPDMDPDGDRLTNAFEYLFGTDPESPSVAGPQPQLMSGARQITYERQTTIPQDLEVYETSSDLMSWTERDDLTIEREDISDTHERITVQLDEDARFFRLRIEIEPAE